MLPPLHIKLGIFKKFVKSLDPEGRPIKLLRDIFPGLTEAKIREGVFVGPDTRKLMKNRVFRDTLNTTERRAFDSMINTVDNFLGKNRSPNYKVIIADLLDSFDAQGVKMSLKIHFFNESFGFLPFEPRQDQ